MNFKVTKGKEIIARFDARIGICAVKKGYDVDIEVGWIDAKETGKYPSYNEVLQSRFCRAIPYIPVLVTDGKDIECGYFGMDFDDFVEKVALFSEHSLDGEITHWLPMPSLPIKE